MRLGRSSLAQLLLSLVAACSSSSSSETPRPDGSAPPSDAGPPDDASDGGTPDAPVGDPPLEWKSCALTPGTTAGSAECAITNVPRDYTNPVAGRIDLGLKRVIQRDTPKAQLWLVDGGPGGSAVNAFAGLARSIRTLRPEIELYAVDHRGVGGSHPLECPTQEADGSPGGRAITDDEWPACIDYLKTKEAEFLPHITTSNSMRDLSHLIDRMKKPNVPVYVWGGSYGTYATMRYMALFPTQADAIVLEGIAPPGRGFDTYDVEMNGATKKVFDLCAANATCAARLGADPWTTAGEVVKSFGAGHCPTLGIDADGARAFLGSYTFYRETRDLLPALVYRMQRCEARDITAIVHFYQALSGALTIGATPPPGALAFNDGRRDTVGLFFHVALSEMWHYEGLPTLASVMTTWQSTTISTGLTVRLAKNQAAWPVYKRGPEVTTDLPAFDRPLLMLQGALDAATAVEPARRLRDTYKAANQTWVEFPNGAHQIMDASPMATVGSTDDCGRKVMLAFLDDPKGQLDTSCTANVVPVIFDGTPAVNQFLFGVADAWD